MYWDHSRQRFNITCWSLFFIPFYFSSQMHVFAACKQKFHWSFVNNKQSIAPSSGADAVDALLRHERENCVLIIPLFAAEINNMARWPHVVQCFLTIHGNIQICTWFVDDDYDVTDWRVQITMTMYRLRNMRGITLDFASINACCFDLIACQVSLNVPHDWHSKTASTQLGFGVTDMLISWNHV